MSAPDPMRRLDDVLRATSRSFYLTLKVAPRSVRRPLGLGYLFCRAADTIADTRLLPAQERLEQLETFREFFASDGPPNPAVLAALAEKLGPPLEIAEERELLESLDSCFEALFVLPAGDRALLRRLVTTLTLGMRMDLEIFPAEDGGEVIALSGDDALDRYCYYVAGCVGEFWTDLQCSHLPPLAAWDRDDFRARGVRFGKGLQLTNILRDVDRDLQIGRCYLPAPRLEAAGVDPETVGELSDRRALRPVVHDLLRVTLDHYRVAWSYTLAIPRRIPRLRLACVWPLWIGLRTLELIAAAEDPCSRGGVLKISRADVTRVLRGSTARVMSNRVLDRTFRRLEASVHEALDASRE